MVTRRNSTRQIARYSQLHRMVASRDFVQLMDARENIRYEIEDASTEPVSHDDTVNVLNVHDVGQVWNLPTIQIQDDLQTISMAGWRLLDSSGKMWEILSVTLASAGHTWRCVTKLMRRNTDE